MKFVRGLVKFSLFFLMILIFLVHHFFMNLIHWNEESRLKSISFYCRLGLKILNVKIDKKSHEKIHGKLIVSNHLSYLDVLIYFARSEERRVGKECRSRWGLSSAGVSRTSTQP